MIIKMFSILVLFYILSWLFISVVFYFIPTIVSIIRIHNNTFAIAILNLTLGWKPIGWFAALLWSLNSDVKGYFEKTGGV